MRIFGENKSLDQRELGLGLGVRVGENQSRVRFGGWRLGLWSERIRVELGVIVGISIYVDALVCAQ